jgi:hypothetical protein
MVVGCFPTSTSLEGSVDPLDSGLLGGAVSSGTASDASEIVGVLGKPTTTRRTGAGELEGDGPGDADSVRVSFPIRLGVAGDEAISGEPLCDVRIRKKKKRRKEEKKKRRKEEKKKNNRREKKGEKKGKRTKEQKKKRRKEEEKTKQQTPIEVLRGSSGRLFSSSS